MKINPVMLLSFDTEEFDMPFEYEADIDFQHQINISAEGTKIIAEYLLDQEVKATFFCTANYALNKPEQILSLAKAGHEIGSHTWYHSRFEISDLLKSRLKLEEISHSEVTAFRMPRMMPISNMELIKAGYLANSSINPTWIPGRYNHFKKPRTWFMEDGLLQIPSSVSPVIRFPLFWLSFHNLPFSMFKGFCRRTLKRDNYLNLYFHPWEFQSLKNPSYNLPSYVTRRSGEGMLKQLIELISWGKKQGCIFLTFKQFREQIFSTPLI